MLGVDALAVVGLASNVIQFFEFTAQLCVRIKQIGTSASGLPKELEKQADQLSYLLEELTQLPEGPALNHKLWQQCHSDAQELDMLLKRFEGGSKRGLLKNTKLAYHSIRQKPEIEKVRDALSVISLCAMGLE